MPTEVVLPMLGITVERGKIIEWLKKEGDKVEKGEIIFIVEVEKATTEVESPASGILAKILVEPGKEVPVLTPVAIIAQPGEKIDAATPAPAPVKAEQAAPDAVTSASPPEETWKPQPAAEKPSYDLAVLGGGPGGYTAAIRAAQLGLKVLLVEKDSLGGTCLNRGCIPTKCYVYDTHTFAAAKHSSFILNGEKLGLDVAQMAARKKKVVSNLVGGVNGLLKSQGVKVVKGRGILEAPGKIQVEKSGGAVEEFTAQDIVIATGSRPAVPPFIKIDGQKVQTTDQALDPDGAPAKMVIIGGGVIGIEMATIYSRMGTEVTILELLPDILINEDIEARQTMHKLMKKSGVTAHLKAKVTEVQIQKKDVSVSFSDESGQSHSLKADKVLVATGRSPVLDGVDSTRLGLAMNGPFVKIDDRCATNLPGVWAIGDVVGGMMLAHKASAEAEAVVENILGHSKSVKPELVPRCIWGFTEIGSVGLSEEEARGTHGNVKVGKFPYQFSGAAQAKGDMEGFVKTVADADTGEVLGVHIMGAHATDLIGEAVLVMTMEGVVEDLAGAIRPHPTFSEIVMESALDFSRLSIHAPKRK